MNPPEIWVGYAPRVGDIEALGKDPGVAAVLAGPAGHGLRIAAVKSSPFEVLAGPVELSVTAIREMFESQRGKRMNLVRVFPMSVMWRPSADAKVESALLRLVSLCRRIPALDAP